MLLVLNRHAKLAEKLRTLLVLTPLVYWCINLDLLHVGEFLCLTAYSLLAFGFLIGRLLETDTLWLTPTLPTDARQILVLFSGTSILPSKPRARKFQMVCPPRERGNISHPHEMFDSKVPKLGWDMVSTWGNFGQSQAPVSPRP